MPSQMTNKTSQGIETGGRNFLPWAAVVLISHFIGHLSFQLISTEFTIITPNWFFRTFVLCLTPNQSTNCAQKKYGGNILETMILPVSFNARLLSTKRKTLSDVRRRIKPLFICCEPLNKIQTGFFCETNYTRAKPFLRTKASQNIHTSEAFDQNVFTWLLCFYKKVSPQVSFVYNMCGMENS